MEENYLEILESGRFDDLQTENAPISDSELQAITHRTIWNSDFGDKDYEVVKRLILYGSAVANEAIKRMTNK